MKLPRKQQQGSEMEGQLRNLICEGWATDKINSLSNLPRDLSSKCWGSEILTQSWKFQTSYTDMIAALFSLTLYHLFVFYFFPHPFSIYKVPPPAPRASWEALRTNPSVALAADTVESSLWTERNLESLFPCFPSFMQSPWAWLLLMLAAAPS